MDVIVCGRSAHCSCSHFDSNFKYMEPASWISVVLAKALLNWWHPFHLHRPLVFPNYWATIANASEPAHKSVSKVFWHFPDSHRCPFKSRERSHPCRGSHERPCWMPIIVIVIRSISRWKRRRRKKHIPIPQIEAERRSVLRLMCSHIQFCIISV